MGNRIEDRSLGSRRCRIGSFLRRFATTCHKRFVIEFARFGFFVNRPSHAIDEFWIVGILAICFFQDRGEFLADLFATHGDLHLYHLKLLLEHRIFCIVDRGIDDRKCFGGLSAAHAARDVSH